MDIVSHNQVKSLSTLGIYEYNNFDDGHNRHQQQWVSHGQQCLLAMQPAFASSLPVQILLNGIVLALTCVLLFHLLFTAQYHWPLAPLNYALQLSGVLSLLISLIATLFVVLSSAFMDTQEWPYMINYLAKDIPPIASLSGNSTDLSVTDSLTWTTAELAGWCNL
ncbi:uncharacterized protein FOMMEDRAFT_163110 [Fomitiporia mediterranea MF3/22]|uniref:Uncharacterized protein n=1 Tax=Fomitiporia mediterranea (strain MF3/22) TaxID=694068 RepID=R7SFK4_FOMME|nr:uncharacterized protein FOMMEDRAFT_163110 [Fomitiporia mediterranea MF3/22]EJC97488.1 hypothetical protein FOMMEDRAFT_163110 [Fomitiporia mediterranea MF3/22]